MSGKPDTSLQSEKEVRQFCTFWISGRLYGIDILDVKEINTELSFSPIPHTHEAVKGYVNIRGQIYLILNLCALFGIKSTKITDSSRVVILNSSIGGPLGLLVDRIGPVERVHEDEIENRRMKDNFGDEEVDRRSDKSNLALGVYKLPKKLLIILDAKRFISSVSNLDPKFLEYEDDE